MQEFMQIVAIIVKNTFRDTVAAKYIAA